MIEESKRYLQQPWRVSHSNGDVVAGFESEGDAKLNAQMRNVKAVELGIDARYTHGPKP